MLRKQFIASLAVAAVSVPSSAARLAENISIIPAPLPGQLRAGGCIGLVAPAGIISEKELAESIENLQKLGFRTKTGKNALARNGYFAGTDAQRAADMNEMFSDASVDGIICVRGGYGAARILPLIDYDLIARNPKVFMGYSDVTALHVALWQKARLVSFHGPVGTSTFNEYSVDNFKKTLMQNSVLPVFRRAEADGDKPENRAYVIRSGTAEGQLAGGNLSILASMTGTPYDGDYRGCILYLEEIGEEPYRIDRMLTQMQQAGKFEGIKGVLLGIFRNCAPKEKESGINNSFSLSEVLYDRFYNLGVPVFYGMSFGHIENKIILPYGITARMDTGDMSLSLLAHAVR